MLLRGTTRVATVAEFASSTSTGSVLGGDCAATKLGTSRQADMRKLAAADGDRPITARQIVCVRNSRYLSGISTPKTLAPTAHRFAQEVATQISGSAVVHCCH